MVLVLSERENKIENEITEMLKELGVSVVTDKDRLPLSSDFTAAFIHRNTDIDAKCGIVIATDKLAGFKNQRLPKGFIGVCSENNKNALKLFKSNNLSVITCGSGRKNTLSVSSLDGDSILLCLQRSTTDINGNVIEPCEIKIKLKKRRDLFSLLATVCVLIYYRSSLIDSSIEI